MTALGCHALILLEECAAPWCTGNQCMTWAELVLSRLSVDTDCLMPSHEAAAWLHQLKSKPQVWAEEGRLLSTPTV